MYVRVCIGRRLVKVWREVEVAKVYTYVCVKLVPTWGMLVLLACGPHSRMSKLRNMRRCAAVIEGSIAIEPYFSP